MDGISDHESLPASSDNDGEVMEGNPSVNIRDDCSEFSWEEVSVSSDETWEQDVDEWNPLRRRTFPYPDIFFPDRSADVFSYERPIISSVEKDDEDELSDNGLMSELNDESYQNLRNEFVPNPTKQEMARIVLDYFILHGNSEPIETFCQEMDIEVPEEELKIMHDRVAVKDAILEGKIEEAIAKLEEICPGFMENNENLEYLLKKQNLVEMIRGGELEGPMMYARENLLKKGASNEQRLEELEKAFALLAYDVDDSSPYHYLYDQNERNTLATKVNSAILEHLGRSKFSKLDLISKSVVWARNCLAKTDESSSPNADVSQLAKESFDQPYALNEYFAEEYDSNGPDLTRDIC